jgi:hypothetical protein
MKTLYLSIIFVFSVHMSTAQSSKDSFHLKKMPFVYFENGISKSYYNFGSTLSLKNSWGLIFNQRYFQYRPENYPANYSPGLCFWGKCEPKDSKIINSIQIQKMFFTRFPEVRYNFNVGVGKSIDKKLVFTPIPRSNSWFNLSSNYIISDETTTAIGFMASSSMEFPISTLVGFKATAFTFLANGKGNSKFGAELNIIYGMVREKLK